MAIRFETRCLKLGRIRHHPSLLVVVRIYVSRGTVLARYWQLLLSLLVTVRYHDRALSLEDASAPSGQKPENKAGRCPSQCRPTPLTMQHATRNVQHTTLVSAQPLGESASCWKWSQSMEFAKKRPRSVAGNGSNNQRPNSTSRNHRLNIPSNPLRPDPRPRQIRRPGPQPQTREPSSKEQRNIVSPFHIIV